MKHPHPNDEALGLVRMNRRRGRWKVVKGLRIVCLVCLPAVALATSMAMKYNMCVDSLIILTRHASRWA